jgi:cell fate regulator YaaT (PSP1 superfamily)
MNRNANAENLDEVDLCWADTGGSPQMKRIMMKRRRGRLEPLSQKKREAQRQPERQGNLGESGL